MLLSELEARIEELTSQLIQLTHENMRLVKACKPAMGLYYSIKR